jgi:hypothetical protein
MTIRQLTILFFLSTLLTTGLWSDSCHAQRWGVEAVAGEPFGVGRIRFDLSQDQLPEPLGIEGVGLSEKHGRAFYPALDCPVVGKVVKEILDRNTPLTTGGPVREQVGGLLRGILDRPPRTTLYFLFRGNEPLELSLLAKKPVSIRLFPRTDPIAHRQLLQLWWRQYAKPPSLFEAKPDYPPLVDTYLTATLARRLNLRLPEALQTKSAYVELQHELGLHFGTESLCMAMMQDRILGLNNLEESADRPLPAPIQSPELEWPQAAENIAIEPIAKRVPTECFYVRFGSFANFLWMQDTLAKWGGDMQNLIALRGLEHSLSGRIEKQLVVKQTMLSRFLGNSVVADVALIGTDMFFHEGASYGLLFQSHNNVALSADFTQQRQQRIKAGGVTEEKVTIGGHTVLYLTSPDGAVRSYYAVDGDFHFIATSKKLIERFFATASGEGSLGASREFRHARSVMPLNRNDTVWLYVSDAFFRNLTSPHYRTEMARRLQAVADIELVQLAQLAAASPSRSSGTIEQLKTSGLLPPEFGPQPDGSRIVIDNGEVYDSRRGRRGAFVPISDMPVEKITRAELSAYQKFAAFYHEQWERMDPILVGVQRNAQKNNRDHILIDVSMSPLSPTQFQRLSQWFGPANAEQLHPVSGDMAAVELTLQEQRIFAGVRDVGRPQSANLASQIPAGRLRDYIVGYIGTDGPIGILSVLNIGIPAQADAAGYAVSPLGGWRRQWDRFTLYSFQHEVLDEVASQLRFESAERPAQVRLHIGDVSQASITPRLNDLGYARTRQTSLGNLRFLHALNQQLHVPPTSCREAAEVLLDAKLICPLGGQYILQETAGEPPHWTSTALNRGVSDGVLDTRAPQDYVSPPLSWFRGLDLDAAMTEKHITAHAEVIMDENAGRHTQ